MARLIHKRKVILDRMEYLTSMLGISFGLMFATPKRIDRGVCLVMPTEKDVKFGASVTMLFVFFSLDVLFVNSNFEVVDKKTLRPWITSYVPEKECRYIIESSKKKFEKINIGDKVQIKL